jgi:hypothetical protein
MGEGMKRVMVGEKHLQTDLMLIKPLGGESERGEVTEVDCLRTNSTAGELRRVERDRTSYDTRVAIEAEADSASHN